MLRTTESPSPVPLPAGLVVKNGSKIFDRSSSLIPAPESDTAKPTMASPAAHERTRMLPPAGSSASAALLTRLITT